MDYALLISTSLPENPNAPPAAILSNENNIIGRHGAIKMDTSKTHEVSKKHAIIHRQITNDQITWEIEDKKSLNSTFLNAKKIKKHRLQDGDEIVFGGGSCFIYGDEIMSTHLAQCRYLFVLPEPPIVFSETSNKDITLLPIDQCEECCICYMPISLKSTLSCGHSFCRKCLSQWSDHCQQKEMNFVCPICRQEFDPSIAKHQTVSLENDTIIIHDVQPFLRRLDIFCLKDIENLSLFHEWNNDEQEKFWNCYSSVSNSPKKFIIFRKVTHTSFQDIKDATMEQLEISKINFKINVENPEYLRGAILHFLANQIYHKEYMKKEQSSPTSRHLYFSNS